MTNRELLEKAARAAGIKFDRSPYGGGGEGNDGFDIMGNAVLDWHNNIRWNSLENDGDEARLEATLGLDVQWFDDAVDVGGWFENFDAHDGDKQKARRWAGTRAAAAIGEGMK